MRGVLRFLAKVFFIITYPLMLVGLVVLGILFFTERQNNNAALNEYKTFLSENAPEATPKENIKDSVKELITIINAFKTELDTSKEENKKLTDSLEEGRKEGYGEIQGNILPFVTSQEGSLSQYQRVCAETKENKNKQYCVSASAIQRSYSLVLPAGDYYVFAQVQSNSESNAKAYYTEFVKCNQQDSAKNCEEKLSEEKVLVTVEGSKTVTNVDPADWSF